jgi:UDPglucose 6-dehydrogenase
MSVNYKQRLKLIPLIKKHFNNDLQSKKIAVWGLAFKPQTDDIREAPALDNIKVFLDGGALVKVHDPEAMDNVKKIFNNKIEYFDNPYDAVKDVDCLFIATEWSEFRTPDFEKLSTLMKGKIIFDGRNLYDLENMLDKGFTYYSIGRKTIYG